MTAFVILNQTSTKSSPQKRIRCTINAKGVYLSYSEIEAALQEARVQVSFRRYFLRRSFPTA